jgi:archaellum component FlaC
VVRLQVDVDAARARAEFEATSRTVDRLGDELDQAEDQARDLRFEFDRASREAGSLRSQVAQVDQRLEDLRSTARAMGNMMPRDLREELQRTERASRDLHRQLNQQEEATRRAARAMSQASSRANLLADELDDAEEEAAELRRELDRLDAEAGRMSNRFRRGLLDSGNQFGRAGQSLGRSFVGGMGPAVLGGVAALGPPVGAVLSAAILAALGTGVAGVGAAIAIKESDALQRSFSRTFGLMGKDIKRFASEFEDELFGVSDRFGRMWDGISGDFASAFAKAEKFVEPLAAGIADLVEGMVGGGGFNNAMDAAAPVIDALGVGLARLGDAFNSFFQSLADGGDGATKGMILLMDMLSGAVIVLGNTLEALSKGFDFYTDAAEDYSAVMAGMLGWIPGIGDAWRFAAEKTGMFNDEASKTRSIVPILGVEVDETGKALDRQAAATQKAAREAQNLSNKLHQLLSDQLTADQAAVSYEQAIDDLAASFQENGRSIDITSQAGRNNVQTFQQVIAAAEAARVAAIELAGGEKASAEAVQAANAEYKRKVDELAAVLRQAGLTQAQIDSLLKAYKEMANAPDLTKRVLVHTTYTHSGDVPKDQRVGPKGSRLFGYASGTSSARAGVALVGERGPELVQFAGGERVFDAAKTARMFHDSGGRAGSTRAALAGGGAARLEIHSGGTRLDDLLVEVLSRAVRARGGDVQRVLGGRRG